MRSLVVQIDGLLRGQYTARAELAEGRVAIPARRLALASLLMGVLYGLCMGLFGVIDGRTTAWQQLAATAAKVPLLFLLTLIVTFPSLYVFSALSNSPLRFAHTFRLLVGAVAVNLTVLASLGPVTAFFTLSTKNYAFMKVLNVLFFGVAGIAGLAFLWRSVVGLFGRGGDAAAAKPLHESRPRRVFLLWMLLYGSVGAQMGWILRPFLGAPGLRFEWFRERESNFVEGLIEALRYAF